MPRLDDMIKKANLKVKSAPQMPTPKITGASKVAEVQVYHRNDEDSPTALFTIESIEEAALSGVQRLMSMWDARIPELESKFAKPEDYAGEANRLFNQYKGLRVKLDSSVAYSIGDTLNRCRERFFDSGTVGGLNWTQFVKTQCSFSFRLAYDFMNIALRLQAFKGKKLSMDQLRALLQVVNGGLAVELLPIELESMSPKQILELLPKPLPSPAPTNSVRIGWAVGTMRPMLTKLSAVAEELSVTARSKKASGERVSLSPSEKDQILSVQLTLRSILSALDNVISDAP